MLKLLQKSPVVELGDGIFTIDLRRIKGGTPSVLSRIPADTPAIYAWYRGFNVPNPETSIPEDFARELISAATSPHCADREARMPPSLKVKLQSHQTISDKKQRAILEYCKNLGFRMLISRVLNMSLLFQQPLYIGKAANLQQRIEQHLSSRSKLRSRLEDAQISIDSARLVFVTLEAHEFEALPKLDRADVDDETEPEGSSSDNEAELPLELVMEELLSRLFLPSFTLRYG